MSLKLFVWTIFLFFMDGCRAILSGNEQQEADVTQNPEYGCLWYGGNSASLVCHCRSDVENFYIREGSIPAFDLGLVRIENCNKVQFGPNAVNYIRNLRNIELLNIGELKLDEHSLTWDNYNTNSEYPHWDMNIPSLKIAITNSSIDQISSYTFKGRIREIVFNNVTVDTVAPFAVSSLVQNQNLQFENSVFKNIQPQAFKKFNTENLRISGTTIDFLPSRAFSDIQVNQNFLISNSTFNTMRPSAYLITNPRRFEVIQSNFNQLDGEAFRVTTRGEVLFKNNVFHKTNNYAFRGITLNREEVPGETLIIFESNKFNVISRDSLQTTDFTPKFINTVLNETCDCKRISQNFETASYEEIHCIDENGQVVTAEEFKNNCSIIASHATLIIIVGSVLIVFVLVTTALVVYFKKIRNSDKYGSEKSTKNGKLSLIVPDGRTYRETELHVIVERADLLTTDL